MVLLYSVFQLFRDADLRIKELRTEITCALTALVLAVLLALAVMFFCEKMLLSRGKKAPPEPFKFGDIVRIEKKVHVGYRYVSRTAFLYIFILLVLNAGNGWVAGGCWDDYY